MTPKVVYFMRPKRYRGRDGWGVGQRGGSGWPISIWTPHRDSAIAIRDAYKDHAAGRITFEQREKIVDTELLEGHAAAAMLEINYKEEA